MPSSNIHGIPIDTIQDLESVSDLMLTASWSVNNHAAPLYAAQAFSSHLDYAVATHTKSVRQHVKESGQISKGNSVVLRGSISFQ